MIVVAAVPRTFSLDDLRYWEMPGMPLAVVIGWMVLQELIVPVGMDEYVVTPLGAEIGAGLDSFARELLEIRA